MANEKRLIDANVVLAKQFTTGLSDASGNYYGYADVVFVDDIENAPTVDAVEVVRCKDCKKQDTYLCPLYHCVRPRIDARDDYFCSYGERRGNG